MPLSYSRRAAEMYRRVQEEVPEQNGPRIARLVVIPGAGHIFLKSALQSRAMDAIRNFLREAGGVSDRDRIVNK